MSRSAVSKAVTKLEKALGARLLNRSTHHLSATEIGAAFAEHCSRILDEATEAERVATSLHAKPRGVLKVAASVAFGTLHVAPALPDFLERYPELKIDMTITDRTIDLAEEGYDVVVRVARDVPPNVVARRLAPVRRELCATPGYFEEHGVPLAPQDLASHNCLDYVHSGDQGLWRFTGPEGEIAVPVSGRLRINDDEALSQAVLGGLGIALLPTFIVGRQLQTGRLRAALSEYIPVEQHVYAIYLPTRHLPAKVRCFIDSPAAATRPASSVATGSDQGAAGRTSIRGSVGMISHLDHLVLTTANEAACIDFYTRVLGMALETFIGGTPPEKRRAFRLGDQKINLHVKGREFEPKAQAPIPGALDLCFISSFPLEVVMEHMQRCQWPIIEGPVLRTGASGPIRSIYVRDPDLNLIEIAEPVGDG